MSDGQAHPPSRVAGRAGTSSAPRWTRLAVRVISAVAGVAGFAAGYDFGHRVDGVLIGAVAGANLGLMAAMLVGAAAEWALRRIPARPAGS